MVYILKRPEITDKYVNDMLAEFRETLLPKEAYLEVTPLYLDEKTGKIIKGESKIIGKNAFTRDYSLLIASSIWPQKVKVLRYDNTYGEYEAGGDTTGQNDNATPTSGHIATATLVSGTSRIYLNLDDFDYGVLFGVSNQQYPTNIVTANLIKPIDENTGAINLLQVGNVYTAPDSNSANAQTYPYVFDIRIVDQNGNLVATQTRVLKRMTAIRIDTQTDVPKLVVRFATAFDEFNGDGETTLYSFFLFAAKHNSDRTDLTYHETNNTYYVSLAVDSNRDVLYDDPNTEILMTNVYVDSSGFTKRNNVAYIFSWVIGF